MLDIYISLSLSMLVCSIVSTHFPGLRLISVALVGLSTGLAQLRLKLSQGWNILGNIHPWPGLRSDLLSCLLFACGDLTTHHPPPLCQ